MKTIDRLEASLEEAINASPTAKLNVSAIASSAGISHSTIYNRYPNIASKIKAHNFAVAMANEDLVKDKLKKLKSEKAQLKIEKAQLEADIKKLVSINARYEIDNAELSNKVSVLEKKLANLNKTYNNIKAL